MSQQYDTIIIGGGHNGLVCANYLAKEGLSVLVLERLPKVGGAVVSEEIHPHFTAPYCAYVCHMFQGKVIEDLDLKTYGFGMYNYDPVVFQPFPDGSYLNGWQDDPKTYEEIRRLSEHDAHAFLDWVPFWERAAGILHRYFFTEPPTFAQVTEAVRGTRDEEVCETMLTVSVRDLLDEYFVDERVKAFFVNAQDMGDPGAPGSILSAAHVSWVRRFNKREYFGIPKGGMSKVSEALAQAAQAQGVEIRTNAQVDQILVEDGVVYGVRLASGEELRSFMVVSNADPKRTFLSLVDSKNLEPAFIHRVKHLITRANCVKFLAALKELPDFSRYLGPGFDPKLITYIRVCPSVEYFQASWDACKNGYPSRHPIMHIQIPSIWDPTLTPRGMHVLSSWTLYYPTHPKEGSWEDAGKEVAENIIETISQYAPNFRECLLDWAIQTPQDIEAHMGMTDGNIRPIDIIPQLYFSRRMPYRAPIQRLYLCGSGTHPGGEITGAPGHNCAQAILKDLQQVVPG